MSSKDYLAALERRKIESGGMLIPSLDEWGHLIDLTLREQEMNYQQSFEPRRRPSQRHDFHRMPVEGSHAMRHSDGRRSTIYVGVGVLVGVIVILWLLTL